MAFTIASWARSSAHANSDIPVVWCYSTADLGATVDTTGYFNDLVDVVNVGDVIFALVDTGGTPTPLHYTVVSNDGTDVDVDNGIGATTDSD